MLTDEVVDKIRLECGHTNGHINYRKFAREIQRAVLAKAGDQESAKEESRVYDSKLAADRVTLLVPVGYKLYASPLPAQAIPEGISIDENLKRLALDYVRCGIGANYSREYFEDRMKEIYYPFRKIIDLIPLSASPKP